MDSMGGLITGGLGVSAGCGLITTKFHLGKYCSATIIIPPVDHGLGVSGGSVPIAPGQSIHVLQQPVTIHSQQPQQHFVPYKAPVPLQPVIIRVQFGDKEYEKNYLIPTFIPSIYVTVRDFTNRSIPKVKLLIQNFTRIPTKVSIAITKYIKIK
jgi:hypothetical protein